MRTLAIESWLNVVARAVCGRGWHLHHGLFGCIRLPTQTLLCFASATLLNNTRDDLLTDLPAMFHPPQAGPRQYEAMTSSDVKRLITPTVVPPSTPAP